MAGLSLPRGGGFWQMGQQHAQGAIGAFQGQRPNEKAEFQPPGKTAGGGLGAAAGMGMAGYTMGAGLAGSTIGGTTIGASAGPIGAVAGAAIGLVAYLLS